MYTFKDFLADLKKWQSEHTSEYYRFLGLLGQEELKVMNIFFALVKQMSIRVPRLVVEDDVRIPQEMADITKRSHTIDRMVKAMGYQCTEPFLMSLFYWVYFERSYEWIYAKIKNPIPGYKLGILKYPLNYIADKYVVKKSLESGIRTQQDWDRFWNLRTEMRQLPFDEVFEELPGTPLIESKAEEQPVLPAKINLPATKKVRPLSEMLNVPDEASKEKLLKNIKSFLLAKSKGHDLILMLAALRTIIIAPSKEPVIPGKLMMTDYREALAMEFPQQGIVGVRTIQRAYNDLYSKNSKGKRNIENSWYAQEVAYIRSKLLE